MHYLQCGLAGVGPLTAMINFMLKANEIFFFACYGCVVLEIKTEYNGLQITDPYFTIKQKTNQKFKVKHFTI